MKYSEDQEIDLSELMLEQEDQFDGNEFGFLDRKKVRNVFVAS
tara:strand:- start:239 stop:367 length:129 start_codon:yes stop_codon:yes gene_type:complete